MIISAEHFLDLVKKNKKLSEAIIPTLIHRLIRETVNTNAYSHFPSDDDVFVSGFDGVVMENTTQHRFLPLGKIYFEIGTKKDCYKGIAKIESDYEKRKIDTSINNKKDYAYIAITTSILDAKKKQSMCDKYNSDNIFNKVLILDAVDITSWMENHINICIWFLQKYGEKIDEYDINLVSDERDRISKVTTPNLSSELFLADNESNSKKLIEDLLATKGNKIITVSSAEYGRDFSYAFCLSSIISSAHNELIERTIVVNSQQAMNYVAAFCENKVVLVNFNCLDDRFAININNTYIFFDTLFEVEIKLNMIERKTFVNEVKKLGYDDTDAEKIAFLVDYNIFALRRLLTKIPSIKVPLWSKKYNKNELIPILLMGEINADKIGDLSLLKTIIGNDVDSYIEKLNFWSEMNQSPILKYENIYRICSRKECFDFIQVDLFSLKLKAIEEQILLALSNIGESPKLFSSSDILNAEKVVFREKLIYNVLRGTPNPRH